MLKLKKIIIIVVLFIFALCFVACDLSFLGLNEDTPKQTEQTDNKDKENTTPIVEKTEDNIYIYAVNDFHGIVYEDGQSAGLAKLFGYLHNKKQEKPNNTIILSSGDMFQGSALSSMSRGELVLDAMNYAGFDLMTIGNHEFDWGLNVVTRFIDGDESNGEAKFPLLGANIIDKNTRTIAEGLQPYAIIHRAGLKIGIIGLIGYGEENDILTSFVSSYSFVSELPIIKKYAKELRDNEKCDIVIVSTHSDSSDYNYELANLTGSERIDAVFNGHTHQPYYGDIARDDGTAPMVYVQSGCYGRYIGNVVITYDYVNHRIKSISAANSKAQTVCKTSDPTIEAMFTKYQEYVEIANEELGVSAVNMYQENGGFFSADALVEKYDVDLGVCNRGGIRSSGFPIYKDDVITYGDIFEIMPFENQVVIVEILGSVIINRLFSSADSYYFISTNVDVNNKTINGEKIDSSKYYKVATIDYLYEKTSQPFMNGINVSRPGDLFRDVIAESVKRNVQKNGKFSY